MSVLPSLTTKYTNFIRPRKLRDDERPLTLTIEHGSRQFKVTLAVGPNENGDPISMRHLAEKVFCETGIISKEQKYYYKGLSWENPEMGPWSPSLRAMGIKSGDKIQLVSFHHIFPDHEALKKLDVIDKECQKLRKQISRTFYQVQRVHQAFMGGGHELLALTYLRRDFDDLQEKFFEQIQVLNSINFDHRDCMGQARRRELIDTAQRQIDKCTDMSAFIFHKVAQSHCISGVGKLYARDLRLEPSRNKWAKKT